MKYKEVAMHLISSGTSGVSIYAALPLDNHGPREGDVDPVRRALKILRDLSDCPSSSLATLKV